MEAANLSLPWILQAFRERSRCPGVFWGGQLVPLAYEDQWFAGERTPSHTAIEGAARLLRCDTNTDATVSGNMVATSTSTERFNAFVAAMGDEMARSRTVEVPVVLPGGPAELADAIRPVHIAELAGSVTTRAVQVIGAEQLDDVVFMTPAVPPALAALASDFVADGVRVPEVRDVLLWIATGGTLVSVCPESRRVVRLSPR